LNEQAELGWNVQKTMLPMIEGAAGERAIDITKQPAASWSLAVGMRLVCWPGLV
jgi:hypothetical protein